MKMPKVRLNKVHSAKYDLILELEKLEVDQLEDLLKLVKLYPNITSESIEYCKEQFELQHTQGFACSYDKDNPLVDVDVHENDGLLTCGGELGCDDFFEMHHNWKNRD